MQRFPQCLFKPGDQLMAGLRLSSITVNDADALRAALADGWFESPEAADAARTTAEESADAVGAPTRAELEQMAVSLNINFDGRTSDRKLAAAIAAKRG